MKKTYTMLDIVEKVCFALLVCTMGYYALACLNEEYQPYFYFLKFWGIFVGVITLIATILNYKDKTKNEVKK